MEAIFAAVGDGGGGGDGVYDAVWVHLMCTSATTMALSAHR
jgi:NAD(P)H-hydrate repair Nnr-like enzyme with NAD(P)H-hydrate epimerase domain